MKIEIFWWILVPCMMKKKQQQRRRFWRSRNECDVDLSVAYRSNLANLGSDSRTRDNGPIIFG